MSIMSLFLTKLAAVPNETGGHADIMDIETTHTGEKMNSV